MFRATADGRSSLIVRGPDFHLRQVLASIAVLAALCAAIIGALLGREESDLALATGGLLDGLLEFMLYALGMGAVVTMLALSIGFFGQALVGRVRRVGRFFEPFGALLLLLTGA